MLLVVTASADRAKEVAECAVFDEKVLKTAAVSKALQCTVCVRMLIENLPADLRERLGIGETAPQLLVLAPDGKKLAKPATTTSAATVARLIESATKKVAADAAKRKASASK